MTKQAGNTSADREAELRKRLADDAGSFGCPADIADLFAMLDEARAQLDEDAEQDAQIEEDAVAEHEHDLEVAYWANQVRDACDVLRPGRFGRGEPGEDPPIVTMAKAVVAERDEATKRAETAERDLDVARSQLDKATRERDSARRTLDRMAEESHTFNAILETTQRALAETRSQLAVLRDRPGMGDRGVQVGGEEVTEPAPKTRIELIREWYEEDQNQIRSEPTIDWKDDAIRDLLAEAERLAAECDGARSTVRTLRERAEKAEQRLAEAEREKHPALVVLRKLVSDELLKAEDVVHIDAEKRRFTAKEVLADTALLDSFAVSAMKAAILLYAETAKGMEE